MNKPVTIGFLVMFTVISICAIYDAFFIKRALYKRDKSIQTKEFTTKDGMKYYIFSSEVGGMTQVNYTLDSMDMEGKKKFYENTK